MSQPYDESAVIWPQNAMPIRSTTPTPYDAKSAILIMSKKLVTPGRTYRTSYRRPAVGRNNGEMTRSKSELNLCQKYGPTQRSVRGWKRRTSCGGSPIRVPRSLPLALLQQAQAHAKVGAGSVGPPCLRFMM